MVKIDDSLEKYFMKKQKDSFCINKGYNSLGLGGGTIYNGVTVNNGATVEIASEGTFKNLFVNKGG